MIKFTLEMSFKVRIFVNKKEIVNEELRGGAGLGDIGY